MAIIDAFVDALVAADKKGNPAKVHGGKILCLAQTFEVAAADSDGSIYRLARLPANAIPVKCDISNDAITVGTDYDLGLYKQKGGAVVDKDLFLDGGDMSSARTIAAPLDGLTNLGGADPLTAVGKKLWELLGLTVPDHQGYDLALTANTVGSAAGTISIRLYYILG